MFKTIAISTTIALCSAQVMADPQNKYDLSLLPADVAAQVYQLQQYGDRFESTIEAIFATHAKPISHGATIGYDLSLLPTDVAAQVLVLMEYGDRFKPVIRAIFAEHVKPYYGFETEDGTGDATMASSPQS